MNAVDVVGLVERVWKVDAASTDRGELAGAMADLGCLASVCDGRLLQLSRQLAQVSSFPEKDLADATRVDLRDAVKITERAALAEQIPVLGAELAAGSLSAAHLDVVGRALRSLEPEARGQLSGQAAALAEQAKIMTPDRFGVHVRRLVERIEADGGMARLERQQRATKLSVWVDQSEMGRLAGQFDPVSFARLHRRLADTVDTMFADATPATCPSDLCAKQDHLRALALVELVCGNAPGTGRPELITVLDTRSDDGAPVTDWGIPVEVPLRVLVQDFGGTDVHAVVVRNGVVIHAPGQLTLGRTTRIANRAQRRVLRGLYATCAIPGCCVRYDNCAVHHIIWWRHGGPTNLENLLPLCSRHHSQVHDQGWRLAMTPDRQLTITLPDRTRLSTGPPKRTAA